MDKLAGRVAVVTGAASGIGRGIAEALAAQGMRIVAADIDGAQLAVTGAELRGTGAEVIERVTDVRDAAAVQALAAAALEAYGAVHVICNNAGVATLGYQWETDLADWSWVIDVNLWGVIHGVRTFVPILLRNTHGGQLVEIRGRIECQPALISHATIIPTSAAPVWVRPTLSPSSVPRRASR